MTASACGTRRVNQPDQGEEVGHLWAEPVTRFSPMLHRNGDDLASGVRWLIHFGTFLFVKVQQTTAGLFLIRAELVTVPVRSM